MDHGAGQADLLGHTGRIVGDHHVRGTRQVERPQQIVGTFDRFVAFHAAQHARIDEQLQARQPVEDLVRLRHHADGTLHCVQIAPYVTPENHGRTAIRHEQAGHHVERGRLAGAVRSDQSVKGTYRNVEGQSVDGHLLPKTLEQAANRNRCGAIQGNGRGKSHRRGNIV